MITLHRSGRTATWVFREHVLLVGQYRLEDPVITRDLGSLPRGGDGMSRQGRSGEGPSGDLKRAEAMLRDARAVLRRLDSLLSEAQGARDSVAPLLAQAQSTLERVVEQLTRRQREQERRLRTANRLQANKKSSRDR